MPSVARRNVCEAQMNRSPSRIDRHNFSELPSTAAVGLRFVLILMMSSAEATAESASAIRITSGPHRAITMPARAGTTIPTTVAELHKAELAAASLDLPTTAISAPNEAASNHTNAVHTTNVTTRMCTVECRPT